MLRAVVVSLGLAILVSAVKAGAADAGAPAASLPSCVQVQSEARYVPYGYNHVVHVRNACAQAAACVVSSDVNPQPQNVDVAPGTTADVTTFMGAAASAFVAKVGCTLH